MSDSAPGFVVTGELFGRKLEVCDGTGLYTCGRVEVDEY